MNIQERVTLLVRKQWSPSEFGAECDRRNIPRSKHERRPEHWGQLYAMVRPTQELEPDMVGDWSTFLEEESTTHALACGALSVITAWLKELPPTIAPQYRTAILGQLPTRTRRLLDWASVVGDWTTFLEEESATPALACDALVVISAWSKELDPAIAQQYRTAIWDRLATTTKQNLKIALNPRNPRDAVFRNGDRLEVNSEALDLHWRSPIPIPQWAPPNKQLTPYSSVRRMYLDIETTGLDPKCDRVLVVGLLADGYEPLKEPCLLHSHDESVLIRNVWTMLKMLKPELLIGHNIFGFDLPFLVRRSELLGVPHPVSFDKREITISSASVHGKPITFTPCRIQGTEIVDTFHQVAIWDRTFAKLEGYGLKDSAIALGLRKERRLELAPTQINECWKNGELKTIGEYLKHDLEDTQRLADFLLPVVWFQQTIVTTMPIQDLAIASPAKKAQHIHQVILRREDIPDEKTAFDGAISKCVAPGLHQDVAKIDIASLYPSIMLRFGLCSRKDPEHMFLGVLEYMRSERLRLKAEAARGNVQATHEQNALKVLINGSYGFMGTAGYGFNDFETAALVTAYGRKILNLMAEAIARTDSTIIELDTDGILFSSRDAQCAYEAVLGVLPDGIDADLEFAGCGAFVPKAKNYVIVPPEGKLTVKGIWRKRNRSPLEREFPVEFLMRYFRQSPEAANHYFQEVRRAIASGQFPVDKLRVTRKIATSEKRLLDLGFGNPGEKVSFYLDACGCPTQYAPYGVQQYTRMLDAMHDEIVGVEPEQMVLAL